MIFTILLLVASTQAADQPTCGPPPNGGGNWVQHQDLPRDVRRSRFSGTVGATLHVGTTGCLTGCTITSTSGHSGVDEAVCRALVRNARFKRRFDESGQAVAFDSNLRFPIEVR